MYIAGIESGEWRLVLLVKELGPVLLSETDALRSTGKLIPLQSLDSPRLMYSMQALLYWRVLSSE